MSLGKKLQIRSGQTIRVLNAPEGFELDSASDKGDAILLFARDSKSLKAQGTTVVEAARRDKLAWIAYPKAGNLGTDLNRDKLSGLMKPLGIQPVRLVSLDETWSAMRFRPG
jgi:hypothetical protein